MENAVETTKADVEVSNAPTYSGFSVTFSPKARDTFIETESKAVKFRMEVRNGNLFVRPTYRAAGPHVLVDFPDSDTKSLKVEINAEQATKLGITLEDGAKMNIKEDKYGWFYLTNDNDHVVDGATAKIAAL